MKTKISANVIAVGLALLSINTLGVAADQAVPVSKKLGYGFEPGLVSGKDYVAGQLIVGLKKGVSTQNIVRTASALGGRKIKAIKGTALLLQFASEAAVKTAVPSLLADPGVKFIERNGFMSIPPSPQLPAVKKGPSGRAQGNINTRSVSTDTGTGYQWHHTVIRKTASLPALSSTPPTVAVIDTGVDYTHPDLVGKVILGKNVVADNSDPYDDNLHGTHVAGIIAATAGNGYNGEGVCPNCKILAVKVLDASGSGTFFDVAVGMSYARTFAPPAGTPPVKVISMSLGGPASALVATEVLALKNAGKVLTAAAGNSNTTTTTNAFPGADPNVALRVMSTESNDCRSFFSNFSPSTNPSQYNIAAPGSDIYSTLPQTGFGSLSGTSMATPMVAGAAALVWGQFPALTPADLVSRLITNGQPVSCGFAAATRRVDVRKAILTTAETALLGRTLDPFTGKAPSAPTTSTIASLFLGTTLQQSDATDTGGSYEMAGLTAGTGRLLRGARSGYVDTLLRTDISIGAVSSSGLASAGGPFNDALPQSRTAGNATVTLDWRNMEPITDTPGCIDSCQGAEFDLYARLPNGTYIEPFSNSGDLATAPFVKNPRDSIDDRKPMETIVIGNSAADGVYKVFVDKYPPTTGTKWDPSWTNSGASVQFYNGAASLPPFYANPPAACGTLRYWHVANLTKTGTAYTLSNVNSCTNIIP